MEAIGKLTGGVAHDFNNLLAAIVGSLDLARRKLAEGADISRFIDNAMKAAERGATLTQRMLAFARKQELKLETVDPVALGHGMADLLQRTIGGGVRIDTQFPLLVPQRPCRPGPARARLLNLAVNARDAMSDGGRIVIAAREEHVGPGEGLRPGGYVCLSVIDTGARHGSRDAGTRHRAVLHHQGRRQGHRSGPVDGPWLCRAMRRPLLLDSRPGEGTTADIWLPVSEARCAEPAPVPVEAAARETASAIVVLAVDDDALVLTNTAAMLEDAGHRVLQAASGKDRAPAAERKPGRHARHRFRNARDDRRAARRSRARGLARAAGLLVSGYADLPEGPRTISRASPSRSDRIKADTRGQSSRLSSFSQALRRLASCGGAVCAVSQATSSADAAASLVSPRAHGQPSRCAVAAASRARRVRGGSSSCDSRRSAQAPGARGRRARAKAEARLDQPARRRVELGAPARPGDSQSLTRPSVHTR
jgi:hypothetical protein